MSSERRSPLIIPITDLKYEDLSLEQGKSFRKILSKGRNAFFYLPGSTFTGLSSFQDRIIKQYVSIDVTKHCSVFQNLTEWLETLSADDARIHPITRGGEHDMELKMRLSQSDDGSVNAGVFDTAGKPMDITQLRSGSTVAVVVHLASVWTMRGVVGLSFVAVQIKLLHAPVQCLIAEEDEYVPFDPLRDV